MRSWKVGELARETGLSIRTLHWYDEIGLLSPSQRTRSGHRLYGAGDVERLQRVVSLRQMGFGLDEIRGLLERPELDVLEVVRLHLERLRAEAEAQSRLVRRLERIEERLRSAGTVPVEEFIRTIEAMTMFEKHYTPEQMERIEARGRELGEARIREVEQVEWPALIADVRDAMERGVDPASDEARELAGRWMALVREFTGGDPGVERAVGRVWKEEGEELRRQHADAAPTPEMFGYIQRVMATGG